MVTLTTNRVRAEGAVAAGAKDAQQLVGLRHIHSELEPQKGPADGAAVGGAVTAQLMRRSARGIGRVKASAVSKPTGVQRRLAHLAVPFRNTFASIAAVECACPAVCASVSEHQCEATKRGCLAERDSVDLGLERVLESKSWTTTRFLCAGDKFLRSLFRYLKT